MDYIDGVAIYESSVYSQSGGTCYAHAIADAILSNQIRIFGWKAITHDMLVEMMVSKFGTKGARTSEVLEWICPQIRPLKWRRVDQPSCFAALDKGRAIVGSFFLTDTQWENFELYFKNYPSGILSP